MEKRRDFRKRGLCWNLGAWGTGMCLMVRINESNGDSGCTGPRCICSGFKKYIHMGYFVSKFSNILGIHDGHGWQINSFS